MGFINWLASLFSEEPSGQGSARDKTGSRQEDENSGSVAILEAPEDDRAGGRTDDHERWWAPTGSTQVEAAPLERPDLSTEARALENLLISHFDGHDLSMPPIPRVAESVLALLGSSRNDATSVAREIAKDQVIAASLLRMTNSPLYRGLQKITALQPAVARMGNHAIRTLMMHESLRAAMFQARGAARRFAAVLWARALAGAHVMRGLSEFTSIEKEEASLMGLLHDIGSVVVLRIMQSDSREFAERIDEATFEYLCAEAHQEFGELVAIEWKLPDRLRDVISDHHSYPGPDDPLRAERLQIQLADMILAALGYAPHVAYNVLEARVTQDLGIGDRTGFHRFLEELPDELDEAIGTM